MKAIIAAAALAVAGTSASAAVYEVDFTAEVTSVDNGFPAFSAENGISNSYFSFEKAEGERAGGLTCNIFGFRCTAFSPVVEIDSETDEVTFIDSIIRGYDIGFVADFANGTGFVGADDGPPGPDSGVRLEFAILDSTTTITEESPDVAPVPLPASAPMLIAAMGGLAWWRRRAA